MVEIIAIFLQLLIFALFTAFPFNNNTLKSKNFHAVDNFALKISINILFLFLILFFFSFLNISQRFIFYFIGGIYLMMLLIYLKKNLEFSWLKKNYKLKISFFLILLFLFFEIAEYPEIGWDGLAIWKFKANNFYLGESFYNLKNGEGSNIQYPHLGSYIWAFFWKNSLLEKEYFGRLFYIYIYVSAIFSIALSLKNISDEKKILIIFFILISTFDRSLHGYQEYLIFSFLTFFGVSLIHSDKTSHCFGILPNVYFLTCALLPWIKLEGAFYSIFIAILFMSNKKNRTKYSFFCTALIFVSIFFEHYVKKQFFFYPYALQGPINFEIWLNAGMLEYFSKITTIAIYFFRGCLKYPIWIFNLLALIVALTHYKKDAAIKFILMFFIFNIGFLFSLYLQVPDMQFYLRTSMDRLILQTSGLYSIILITLINKKIIKF